MTGCPVAECRRQGAAIGCMLSVTARCVIAIHISATSFPPRRQIRCQPERHTGRPFRHTGRMPMRAAIRPRGRAAITVVLGPTNTGKTHLALERMTGYASGMIGFPLRLLARENYDRLVAKLGRRSRADHRRGADPAARRALSVLHGGSMPVGAGMAIGDDAGLPQRFDFVAVDEVQLAGDRERGHVFTDRILHARGIHETMFLGAETARRCCARCCPTPGSSRASACRC